MARSTTLPIGIVAVSFLVRLAAAARIGVMPQEAYYWNYAQRPGLGYFDHPPGVAWMIWATTRLFGQGDLALRAGPLACAVLTSFFLFRLTRDLGGDARDAWRTLALLNALPVFLGIGFLAFPDAPLTAAWAAALCFGQRAAVGGRLRDWLAWGAAVGVAMLSKYYGAALLLSAGLFALGRGGRSALRGPGLYLGALLALALFSPVVWWNSQHDWVSFRYQFGSRAEEEVSFGLPGFALYQLAAVTPVMAGMGLVLAVGALRSADLRRRWLAWNFWALFAAFALFSLQNDVHLNWTAPAWLSLLPLAQAYCARRPDEALPLARWSKALRGSALVGALAMAWLLAHLAGLPLAWLPTRLSDALAERFRWRAWAAAVEQVEAELRRSSGREPFLLATDKYYLASELAYLDADGDWRDVASRNLLGGQALAWGLWTRPGDFVGRDAVIVGKRERHLAAPGLVPRFEALGPIERLPLPGAEAASPRSFYRIGYGYRGAAPQR